MSTVEENVIPDGISVPDEAVHQAVVIGPHSRRELNLTITRAHVTVISNQPGPIVPVVTMIDPTPLVPVMPCTTLLPAQLPPQYPTITRTYDKNLVCCLKFFHYLDKAESTGRLPPGPKPHDSSCPRKSARKRFKK
jgi:hypothetical protein